MTTLVVALTTLRTPQCMEDMLVNLISFDPYQVIEQFDPVIANVETIMGDIAYFLENNDAWRIIIDGFTLLVDNVSPFKGSRLILLIDRNTSLTQMSLCVCPFP